MTLLRTAFLLLIIAGAMLVAKAATQLLWASMLDFVLITAAHLLLAVAVPLLAIAAIRHRPLGVALGAVWGLGWLLFGLREALMLFYINPPGWTSPLDETLIILGGVAAGLAAAIWPARTPNGRPVIAVPIVLVFAALSSCYLWMWPIVTSLPWGWTFTAGLTLEALSALTVLVTGIYAWRRDRARTLATSVS